MISIIITLSSQSSSLSITYFFRLHSFQFGYFANVFKLKNRWNWKSLLQNLSYEHIQLYKYVHKCTKNCRYNASSEEAVFFFRRRLNVTQFHEGT